MSLTAKNIQMLGQMLLKRRPDLANEFLQECLQQINAPVKDTSLIGYYFDSYCELLGITKSEMVDRKHDHEMNRKRNVFIGMVLKIYHPYIFSGEWPYFKPKNGLVTNLSTTLKTSKGNTSVNIKKAVRWIHIYADYRQSVESAYSLIIGQSN